MAAELPSCLLVGTGEYTTGLTSASKASQSDKRAGVVFLVHADLRARGVVGPRIVLCGTSGAKMPAVREHLRRAVGDAYEGLDAGCETVPADDEPGRDPRAYLRALDGMDAGDVVSVFTPDDTHFDIAMAAVDRGLHVLVTKPAVMTLEHHIRLRDAARRKGVLVAVEVHKRHDPMYSDARNRARELGDFSFFVSYMSQPKTQLETFRAWASARVSDISYYLNSHHVDYLVSVLAGRARPERVSAEASTGVADAVLGTSGLEDSITLTVRWRNLESGSVGTAVHTATWAAPPGGDAHSQQRFHFMAHRGQLTVDQAHRGFTSVTDAGGHASVNPLFMRYVPDSRGRYAGQNGYGYISFERFVRAACDVRAGRATPADFDGGDDVATLASCAAVTAVLEAGRRSLDADGAPMRIVYGDDGEPLRVEPVAS